MTVETATYINQLDSSKPASGDARSEGDDHMRLLKSTLQATFPNISGAVTATQGQLNGVLLGQATYVAGGGAADAYTASINTTQITSYSDGLTLLVKSPATNTGASTINVNSLGVKTIVRNDGTALSAGDLVSGSIFSITYNITSGKFHLAAPLASSGQYVPLAGGSMSGVLNNSSGFVGPLTGNVTGDVSGTAPAGSLTGTTLASNVTTASINAVTPTGGTLAVNGAQSLTGNLSFANSNGIDFSATPGTGTSELLSDYEEGTWTPGQGGGVTVVGTYSSSGTYTKVGRLVTIQFMVAGSTSIEVPSGGNFITGLPFAGSSGVYFIGSALNGSATSSSNPIVLNSIVYSAEAIAATNAIYGTCTYMV